MASAVETTKLPDHQQVELAREGSAALARLLRNHPQQDRARVRMDDEDLILPRQAVELLRHVLSEMAQGNGVSILPVHAELTTQQAAKYVPLAGQAVSAALTYTALRYVCEQHIQQCAQVARQLALPAPVQ